MATHICISERRSESTALRDLVASFLVNHTMPLQSATRHPGTPVTGFRLCIAIFITQI